MSGKIKLALVGCGGMCYAHVNRLKDVPEAEVVALCDIKPEATEKMWKNSYGSDKSIRRYDSFESLMKDPPRGLRGVVLVTPHTVHFPHAMMALEKGYDVLVEKPMVTSSAHAKKLAAQVKKTGRHLQIAFQAPFCAEFAYIREALQNEAIGELQTITAYSCQGWKQATNLGNGWRQNPKLSGGGQMYDTGAHLFNSIAWLIDRPALEVYCRLDKKGTPVDINAAITILFEGGVLGSVTISGNTPGWQEGIWLAGDKGRLVTGIHGGKLEHYDIKGQLIKYPRVTQAHFDPTKNFVHCLLGVAEPRCTVRYGILHSWLMDALYESASKNRPVKLTKPPLEPVGVQRVVSRPGGASKWSAGATVRVANPC
ncbi:MAG: Gfo/Idh/MocA family oxidoreductase [Phycisphaerales bacterium]|nr:Gfo/Idh/MocA family oxidoreductase [Phycisphaerales bacterium]